MNTASATPQGQLPLAVQALVGVQSSPPNRVRTGTGNSGTLLVRRTLVNKSGRTLSRVRLHVTRITSQNSPLIGGNTLDSQADVRLLSSNDEPALTTP